MTQADVDEARRRREEAQRALEEQQRKTEQAQRELARLAAQPADRAAANELERLARQIAETEAKTKAIEQALAAEDRAADREIAPGLMHVGLPTAPILFEPGARAEAHGYVTIEVPIDSLGGQEGSKPGALEGVDQWVASGRPLEQPLVGLDDQGRLNIADGRHRVRWMVEHGYKTIPVSIRAEEALILEAAKPEPTSLSEHAAELELRKLLLLFGMRQAGDAARRVGGDKIPESLQAQAIAGQKTGIKWFWELRQGVIQRADKISFALEHEVRTVVRDSIAEWSKEIPKPSAGEIARRLHTQVHAGSSDERLFVFSPERAAIIAQTELAQAENTGIFEGYAASGVREIEWLAQTDGRSGDRHHEKLNKTRRPVGETWTDGLGNDLRYPGDPLAPIGSTINCRCTTRAVFPQRARVA